LRSGTRIYRGGLGFGDGRHVLAVLGGKGGVGKSTTSVNLGIALSAMGFRVGVLDGDLNAPDLPHLVGLPPSRRPAGLDWDLWRQQVRPPSQWRAPQSRYGMELTSIGFLIPEESPPVLTSRLLVSALLSHLVFEVAWTADVLLIDCPPGTGHELQVLTQELPLSGAILVTTPQDLAQLDAGRTATLLAEAGVPIVGVVQNMAALACPHCGQEIDLFSRSQRLDDAGLPTLGRLPFDVRLSEAADRGTPLVLADPRGPVAREFAAIGARVRRWLAERDAA
jgi:ATP-binding protein involved in chromosome partitioning